MFIENTDLQNAMSATLYTQAGETLITNVVTTANSLVEANLKERYSLPLNDVPTFLKDTAISIAKYKLMRYKNADTEEDQKDYDDALRILRDLRSGLIVIGSSPVDSRPKLAVKNTRTQVFTDDFLANY